VGNPLQEAAPTAHISWCCVVGLPVGHPARAGALPECGASEHRAQGARFFTLQADSGGVTAWRGSPWFFIGWQLALCAIAVLVALLRGAEAQVRTRIIRALAITGAAALILLVLAGLGGFTHALEPGAAVGTAVVLVLMTSSLVPPVARWVRTFPAPGASGPSSDPT
jgi:hypothetical protein